MPLNTIADVRTRLDDIIALARRARSRIGYFASLYRRMTAGVAADMAAGDFEDGRRLEHLAIDFATRYFDAYDRFRAGEHPGAAWKVAFDAAASCRPTVVEHLLLGISAHINFDLGPATFAAAEGPLADTRADFDRINDIVAEVYGVVQDRLDQIAPALAIFDWVGGQDDERLIANIVADARKRAWRVADALSRLPAADQETLIRNLDADVATLNRQLLRPSVFGPLLCAIRATQRPDVGEIIDLLSA
jgi:hypothetical protein